MWHCETVLAKVKSILGNVCANVFTQGKFTKVIPVPVRQDVGLSLIDFTDDVGIPEMLTTDGAGEFTDKDTSFICEVRKMCVKLLTSEQGHKNQNHPAEREIGILAKQWKARMSKKHVPK